MLTLSLVLPVHNEEKIIKQAFIEIKKALDKLDIAYECILVENGSSDHSLKIIRKLSGKYPHTKVITASKGYGSAVLAGLKVAQGKYVCYMPSDGQIDLQVFPQLWELTQSGQYDLVKVKRITREGFIRLFVSHIFSGLTALFFNIPLIDINGSPRIFQRKHLKKLDLHYQDSFIDTEFAVKAHQLGWQIKEIPMKTLPRIGGQSTRSWRTFIEFFRNLWEFRTR